MEQVTGGSVSLEGDQMPDWLLQLSLFFYINRSSCLFQAFSGLRGFSEFGPLSGDSAN
ncbi:MAG: hypothetical protein V2B19_23710 [Pseudomonadota bacterium]